MTGRQKRRLKPGLKLAMVACLYVFVMGCLSYALFYGYESLHTTAYFKVDQLVFQGTSVRTEPAMRKIFADVRGRNLFSLNLNFYQAEVLKHPWVESVQIHRELPDQILIRIQERKAVGICQVKDKVFLYDDQGCVIDEVAKGKMVLDTPILSGIREESLNEDILFGFHFLGEIRAENESFWQKMEEIDIADRENIVAFSSLIKAPVYLGRKPEPGNLARFMSVIPYINQNYPELEYVELAVPRQVVIMPRGGLL